VLVPPGLPGRALFSSALYSSALYSSALPFLSVILPSAIRMMSIELQMPQPPRVRSWATPEPMWPR